MKEKMKSKFVHSCDTADRIVNFDTFIKGIYNKYYSGYGAVVEYCYSEEEPTVDMKIDDLCFVHGSKEDLFLGKRCVVRDRVVECTRGSLYREKESGKIRTIWIEKGVERAVIHMPQGWVILVLGITPNGNSIIVIKDK